MLTLIIFLAGNETSFRGRFNSLAEAQAKVTSTGPWHTTPGPPDTGQGVAQFAAVYNEAGEVVSWCRVGDAIPSTTR